MTRNSKYAFFNSHLPILMKKLFPILLIALAGMIIVSCGSKSPRSESNDSFWGKTGSPSDSLLILLDAAYINEEPARVRDSLTSRFIAAADTSLRSRLRVAYWSARSLRRLEEEDSARKIIEAGLELADSSRFPYERSRLVSLLASLKSTPVDKAYRLSSDNLRYYESIGDSLMLGSTLMRLGALMWSISDTIPAANYYLRADTVFREANIESYRIRNLLNLANIYDKPSSHTQRDSLMSVLLASEIARRDSDFYHVVLRNQYFNTGDFRFLKQAYNYLGDNPAFTARRAAYEGEIADYFIGNELPSDSVIKYARKAFSQIDRVADQYDRAAIFNAMAFSSYMTGDYNSALDFYREFLDARLALEREHFSLQTSKMEHLRSFELRQHEEKISAERSRSIWIASLSTGLILILVIAFILYLRVIKDRLRRREAEIELQRSRNYLRAYALDIDEKNRLISSIINNVDSLRKNGRIGKSEAAEITSNVKRSLGNTIEKETFTELYKRLHPEFMLRLKKDYPSLTESQLKHAAYIAMGMSAKQIAQALNIEYVSVKKSRTRLRQRMQLSSDQSLEDTLRIYDR